MFKAKLFRSESVPRDAKTGRGFRPDIEGMERREMLAGGIAAESATRGPNWYYVQSLNATLSHSTIPAAQVERLARQLDLGVAPRQVVNRMLNLPRTLGNQVEVQYQKLLDREPTRRELNSGVRMLAGGHDERAIAIRILGSREYYARAGGTREAFLDALYRRVVGRAPSSADVSAGAGSFDSPSSRRNVARRLMNSPEGLSRLASPFRALPLKILQPGAAPGAAEAQLKRPDGLRRLMATVFGSGSYFDLVSAPPTPPRASSGLDALPSSLGLQSGTKWDIGTRWIPYSSTADGNRGTAVAIGPDGLVWQGIAYGPSFSDLQVYNPATNQATNLATFPIEGTITSIAAPQAGTAWFTTSTGQNFQAVYSPGSFSLNEVPTLQSSGYNDKIVQFSSDGNGAVFAIGTSGIAYNILVYSTLSWGSLESVGFSGLSALSIGSIGSDSNILGLSRPGDYPVILPLRLDSNNVFQPENFFLDKGGAAQITATADGAAWAVGGDGKLYLWTPDTGSWHATPAQTLPGPLTAIAGTSQYRLTAITGGPASPLTNSTLNLLSYGIADRPKVGFPPLTPEQQIAYTYISQSLLDAWDDPEASIRAHYDDASMAGVIGSWATALSSDLHEKTPPPIAGVSQAVWDSFTLQLAREVKNVSNVITLFPNLNMFVQQVDTGSQSLLGAAASLVGLSTPEQGTSAFEVALIDLFQAALAGVITIDTGGGAAVVAAAAAGFNSAIADLTGTPNPSADTIYSVTVAELDEQLKDFYDGALEANAAFEDAILSDYGRFMTLGGAIGDGSFTWDYSTYVELAALTTNGFNRYFYEVLMPLKWNIVSFNGTYDSGDGYPIFDYIPSYDVYFLQSVWNQINPTLLQFGNFRFLNRIGANTSAYGDGSYHLTGLLDGIYMSGVNQADLFTGANGWLQVVVSSSPPIT